MKKKDARDPDFIAKLRISVKAYCKFHRRVEFEDLFQSVYLKYLEGKRDRSAVAKVCVCVYRDIFGHGRKPNPLLNSFHSPLNYRDVFNGFQDYKWQERVELNILAKQMFSELKDERTRVVFAMYSQGFTMAEIGKTLRLSEARVSLLVKEVQSKWKRKMSLLGIDQALSEM